MNGSLKGQTIKSNLESPEQINSILESVDKQIWEPFIQALKNQDYATYNQLHHTHVLRISNDFKGIVQTGTEYFEYNKTNYQKYKEVGLEAEIKFAFSERIVSEKVVSDKGFYKYVYNKKGDAPKSIFGAFQVISYLTGEGWKIILDYDFTDQEGKYEVKETDFNKYYLGTTR